MTVLTKLTPLLKTSMFVKAAFRATPLSVIGWFVNEVEPRGGEMVMSNEDIETLLESSGDRQIRNVEPCERAELESSMLPSFKQRFATTTVPFVAWAEVFDVASSAALTLSVKVPSELYVKVTSTLTFWNVMLVESAKDSAFKQKDCCTEALAEFLSP